jgi:hypothetical protein
MAGMRLRASAASFVLAALLRTGPSFAGDPAAAREQLKLGYTLAQEGKCGEAVPHLAESLRLDPRAITLINLADCEEKTGKLTSAMTHWVDARTRAQVENNGPIQEEAERRAKELDPRLPRLKIVLATTAPENATVERDGIVLGAPSLGIPLPLDPGVHTIVVRAPGRREGAASVTIAEGETKQVEVDVAPGAAPPGARSAAGDAKGSPVNVLAIAGLGGAAVALGVGLVTGVVALGAGKDAETACPDLRCSQAALDDVESGRTVGTISTIAFVVAGIGAAIGVYGLVTHRAPAAAFRGSGLRIAF